MNVWAGIRRIPRSRIEDDPPLPPETSVGRDVEAHTTARFHVTERLVIGDGARIGANCEISGRDVVIGREFWMDDGAVIGGGSCFERHSSFEAGDFLHMGRDSFINTARRVEIGDEVGLGMGTKIFTHGAYLSALQGFPVTFSKVYIGSRVWIPGAVVNPGVIIGQDVVIGVGAVVNSNIPDGALAGGVPAKVIREKAYPAPLDGDAWARFWLQFFASYGTSYVISSIGDLTCDKAIFMMAPRVIYGYVTEESERLRNELRRYGIRFWSRPVDGEYDTWR